MGVRAGRGRAGRAGDAPANVAPLAAGRAALPRFHESPRAALDAVDRAAGVAERVGQREEAPAQADASRGGVGCAARAAWTSTSGYADRGGARARRPAGAGGGALAGADAGDRSQL